MRLMGPAELAAYLGVSRQRAYQLAHRRDFPAPVQILRMGPVWDARKVEAWQEARREQGRLKEETVGAGDDPSTRALDGVEPDERRVPLD